MAINPPSCQPTPISNLRGRTDAESRLLVAIEEPMSITVANPSPVAVAQAAYSFVNITSQTTTVVKSAPGVLRKILINKAVVAGVVTIYDNTAGSGTKLGTITMPAVTLLQSQLQLVFDAICATGITVVTSGASMDITVIYE